MKLSDLINFSGCSFVVHPIILRRFGSKAGLFLCRIIWWQHGPDEWIEKDIATIEYETGLTADEQRTARARLVKEGILREEHKRLEHKLCFKIVPESLEMELSELSPSQDSPNWDSQSPQMVKTDFGNSEKPISTVEVHKKVPLKVQESRESEKNPKTDHQKFIQDWFNAYEQFHERPYHASQADFAAVKKIVASKNLLPRALPIAEYAWSLIKAKRHGLFYTKFAATISGLLAKWNEINTELDLNREPEARSEDKKFLKGF